MDSTDSKAKLANLPHESGVYLMKDDKGVIIYVGKAKDLKARVNSYFRASEQLSLKTAVLVKKIKDFEIILTKNEVEALLLERTLIKHHQPVFNILLQDDKQYPFVRVDLHAQWPRFEKVRRRKDDGAQYLGPFSSSSHLKVAMQMMYKIFPLIRCSPYEFANARRPCNYYHMKLCLGPCTLPVSRDQYLGMVKDAIGFLEGRSKDLAKTLKTKMIAASKAENYELAATLRDQLEAFHNVTQRQVAVVHHLEEGDAVGMHQQGEDVSFHILMVREGKISGSEGFILKSPVQTDGEALNEFLLQYYDRRSLPKEVLIPQSSAAGWENFTDLAAALASQSVEGNGATSTKVSAPQRGEKHDLVELACKNAHYALDEALRQRSKSHVELAILQDKLSLPRFPHRIECIDISNLQGQAIVASDVCFIDGKPAKELYRNYIIQEVNAAPDDYASIKEVVRRRLERALRDEDLPDLLVIDGGKGQLSSAMAAIAQFPGLQVSVVSLAKSRTAGQHFMSSLPLQHSDERVFFPDREEPLALETASPEFRILTHIRDEAHRFAITHHRKRRGKMAISSELESIRGIGPGLRKKLLETFGGLDGLRRANLDQLLAIKGMRESAAVALHSKLKENLDAYLEEKSTP